MSGGKFNYSQRHIINMASDIQEEINSNNTPFYDEWRDDEIEENWSGQRYSDETIIEFKNGIEALRRAYVYAQRIDWLLSGDDGEEEFHQRLKEDLENFKIEEDEENF